MTRLDSDEAPLEVAIARVPLPHGEPGAWLAREVLDHGAVTLPVVVMAGTATERLLALESDREPSWRGAVEQAFFADPEVRWTASWGTAMVVRHGGSAMVTFARLRERAGQISAWLWHRLPGLPPEAGMAEEWLGRAEDVPHWLADIVPPLTGPTVHFIEQEAGRSPPEWPGGGGLPAPDTIILIGEHASLADAAQVAGQWLEARFVTEGSADPVTIAWKNGELALWWTSDADPDDEAAQLAWARGIGGRVARHPETLAVGLFGMGSADDPDESISMIAVLLEPRVGDAVMWLRRFAPVSESTFRWLDDGGEVRQSDSRLGWFQ